MQQVIINVDENKYALLLQLLQSLDYVKVVKTTAIHSKNSPSPKYDFSDLAGNLQWKGNALTEQRKLRDEW